MLRGKLPYSRKQSRKLIESAAAYGPISVHHGNNDETCTIETVHDVRPIIKANLEDQKSSADGGISKEGFWRLVARIPNGLAVKMFQLGINPYTNEDWPRVVAFLDDPEYSDLRAHRGHLGKRPHRLYMPKPRRQTL